MARQGYVGGGSLNSGTRALLLGAASVVTVSILILMLNNLGGNEFGSPGLPIRQGGLPAAAPPVLAPTPSATPPSSGPSVVGSSPSVSVRPTSATTSRRPPAQSQPPPPAGSFAATHELRLAWNNGHISRVTVRNTGTGTANWSLAVTVDGGVRLDRYWVQGGGAADVTQSGTVIRGTGRLGGGVTVIVEYQVTRPAGASTVPRACSVNGSPCG